MKRAAAEPTMELMIGDVQLAGYRCRCGHEWTARNKGERPRVCPKCKSPNWDKPYQWRRPVTTQAS
jgi:predicted Zn-ribbon and HTH transcriptional regulator